MLVVEVFVGIQRRDEVVVSQRDFFACSERMGYADRIFDLSFRIISSVMHRAPKEGLKSSVGSHLSPIALSLSQVIDLPSRDRILLSIFLRRIRAFDKSTPHLCSSLLIQIVVLNAQVDTTFNGIIKGRDSVRSQYHNALKVFELAKEDGD